MVGTPSTVHSSFIIIIQKYSASGVRIEVIFSDGGLHGVGSTMTPVSESERLNTRSHDNGGSRWSVNPPGSKRGQTASRRGRKEDCAAFFVKEMMNAGRRTHL